MNDHVRNIYFYFTFCIVFVKLVTLKPTRAYKSPRQSKFKKTHRFKERFHVTSSAILVSSKTMKWRPCWCSGSPVDVLKPFSYVKTFPFPKSLRSCWSLDWKGPFLKLYSRWRHPLMLVPTKGAFLFSKQKDSFVSLVTHLHGKKIVHWQYIEITNLNRLNGETVIADVSPWIG